MIEGRNLIWVDGVNSAVMAHFVLKEIPDAIVAHCDLGDSVHEDSHRFIDELLMKFRPIGRLTLKKTSAVVAFTVRPKTFRRKYGTTYDWLAN